MFPYGTFEELIHDRTIDHKDVVYCGGYLSNLVPRIKHERFFEMLGNWITKGNKTTNKEEYK